MSDVVHFVKGEPCSPDPQNDECPIGRLMFGALWPEVAAELREGGRSPPETVTITKIDRGAGTITFARTGKVGK